MTTLLDEIAAGESEILELKRSTGQLPRAGQTLCCFLNARGGKVVLGTPQVTPQVTDLLWAAASPTVPNHARWPGSGGDVNAVLQMRPGPANRGLQCHPLDGHLMDGVFSGGVSRETSATHRALALPSSLDGRVMTPARRTLTLARRTLTFGVGLAEVSNVRSPVLSRCTHLRHPGVALVAMPHPHFNDHRETQAHGW